MKKKIITLIFLISVLATGCGTDKEVEKLVSKINTLDEVTLNDEAYIIEILNEYSNLNERKKKEVNNFNKLEDASKELYKQKYKHFMDIYKFISLHSQLVDDIIECAVNSDSTKGVEDALVDFKNEYEDHIKEEYNDYQSIIPNELEEYYDLTGELMSLTSDLAAYWTLANMTYKDSAFDAVGETLDEIEIKMDEVDSCVSELHEKFDILNQ